MQAPRRIALLLEYDGTNFHGFQRQYALRTVQETTEDALATMTQCKTLVRASSRTDAGVHARGLPVAFETSTDIPPVGFQRGLNSMLPHDVSVCGAAEVSEDFNVRRSSRGKTYRYSIWNGEARAALLARRSWYTRHPLDLDRMRAAAARLVGEHDFAAFRASDCQSSTTIRRMTAIEVAGAACGEVTVTVEGNAFLQHMVRIIVGTMVDVGRGHREVDFATTALESRDRRQAGPTAPAHGLMLERVHYDPDPFV